jgi:protein-tyrosine phosphatase
LPRNAGPYDGDIPISKDSPRWIELDGAANARVVVPGVLLRSDNLQSLSDGDVRTLIDDFGLEAVIDLRTDVEVRLEGPGPLVGERDVRIEHRSLYPDLGMTTDIETDLIKPWGDPADEESLDETPTVRAYMSYLRRRPDSIVASVQTIAHARGSVLVHCAAGKDRTGVVVALALDAAGVDRELIVADYLATGERIVEIINGLVASDTYRRELHGKDPHERAPQVGTLERVFELIDERHAGTEVWLRAHRFDDKDLEQLRRRIAGPSSR